MKITDKVKMAVMGIAAVSTLGAAAFVAPVSAASDYTTISGYTTGTSAGSGSGQGTDLMSTLQTIINVALGLIGFVAVVMIILGGFQYITSSGDAAKVTKAKNTIMYGVIGLVIALLAFAIVNFILGNVFK